MGGGDGDLEEAGTAASGHLARDGQGSVRPGQLVPEVVVGCQLDRLLGGDQ